MPPLPVPDTVNKPATSKARKPPEERFWKHYSPHHEFPLSVVSSFFLHILAFGFIGLILAGALMMFVPDKAPLPVESINVGGGGGNPNGVGNGPNTGVLPHGEETAKQETEQPKFSSETPSEKLNKPEVAKAPLLDPKNTDKSRMIDLPDASGALAAVGDKARAIRDQIAGRGQGGKGSGDGEGSGVGPGKGSGVGPGNSGRIQTEREKRNERWAMKFEVSTGEEYLRQLADLGAILAVPAPGQQGKYVIYRDLNRRPVQGNVESLAGMNRIFWRDEKPRAMESLANAMGLDRIPDEIIAFFPVELESKLAKLEHGAYPGPEDNIQETLFRIVREGGHYEPKLERVKTKR
jgi:hypothetical protein